MRGFLFEILAEYVEDYVFEIQMKSFMNINWNLKGYFLICLFISRKKNFIDTTKNKEALRKVNGSELQNSNYFPLVDFFFSLGHIFNLVLTFYPTKKFEGKSHFEFLRSFLILQLWINWPSKIVLSKPHLSK